MQALVEITKGDEQRARAVLMKKLDNTTHYSNKMTWIKSQNSMLMTILGHTTCCSERKGDDQTQRLEC